MIHVLRSYVVGPLEPFAEGIAAELARQGYTVDTMRQQLGLVAHLSRGLAACGLDVAELAPQVVERYVDARRAAGYRQFRLVKALALLLGCLRGLAVLTDAAPRSVITASGVLLQRFRAYLLDERALGAASARGYADLVAAIKQHLQNLYDEFAIPTEGERRVRLANEAIRRGAVTIAMLRDGGTSEG